MKADLSDKKALTDKLAKEREENAKLESDLKDLQSRYFKVKEALEAYGDEKALQDNEAGGLDPREMEEALVLIRQRKSDASR